MEKISELLDFRRQRCYIVGNKGDNSMITFKEQCEVHHNRYGLNAAETAENVKMDRDMRSFLNVTWKTKVAYDQWLRDMEALGSEGIMKV